MRKVMEKGEIGKNGDGFIDRSKVRILLCENDSKSSEEVFTLLCKCSYQVTSVRSPRQVVDALNAEGSDIDIILSEVDLPMTKGLKMLKYLMRDKELRRIPVIMMSAQDEVSIVVKCLKLGAADYLVKPLRTNELLNLWTHMWRRRQMLGLAEKNILSYDFDLIGSDPSDANTSSTTLFSDDTDEKSPILQELENKVNTVSAAPVSSTSGFTHGCQLDFPGCSDQSTGQMLPFVKKNKLKIGESSAFFTYVKSTLPKHNTFQENVSLLGDQVIVNKSRSPEHLINSDLPNTVNLPVSVSVSPKRICTTTTPPLSLESSQQKSSCDFVPMPTRNESRNDVSAFQTHAPYPYYIHQMMMSPSPMYQNNLPYGHIPHCYTNPHGMSFPYYPPYGVCLQSSQIPSTTHPWPLPPSSSHGTVSGSFEPNKKPIKLNRREAALIKFRKKRKERCFNKKVRYVNRKKLAEQRPRVKGQFTGKMNGVTLDLNAMSASVDDDDDEDDDVDVYEDDVEDEENQDS